MLVFHGTNRNAEEYRDWAKCIADRTGGIVATPLFSREDFPTDAYQMGGLMKKGKLQPEADWTWSLVPKVADELRKKAGRPDMPYYLIGHSAGGQFLIRMAGFVKTDAVRIVASNPGSLLFPTEEMPVPYGFGELPKELGGEIGAEAVPRPADHSLPRDRRTPCRTRTSRRARSRRSRATPDTSAARTPSRPRRSWPRTRTGNSTGRWSRPRASVTSRPRCSRTTSA